MDIYEVSTGEVWDHVRLRDRFRINRLRKAGLDDRTAKRLVLGEPIVPARTPAHPELIGW